MATKKQYKWVEDWHDAAWANAMYHVDAMCRENAALQTFERVQEGTIAIRSLKEVIELAATMVFLISGGLPMLNACIDIPDIREEEFAIPKEPHDETEASPEPAVATPHFEGIVDGILTV